MCGAEHSGLLRRHAAGVGRQGWFFTCQTCRHGLAKEGQAYHTGPQSMARSQNALGWPAAVFRGPSAAAVVHRAITQCRVNV